MDKKEDEFEDKFLNLDDAESVSPVVKVKNVQSKKIVKKSFKQKTPSNKNTIWRSGLVSFGVFLGVLVILVITSGIIKIPVLSQVFYGSPKPTKTISDVLPAEIDKDKNGFNFDKASGVMTVKVSEEYLTAALRQFQAKTANPRFAQNIQIAIDQDHLEFYGTLLYPINTELTLWFKPNLANQSLTKFFKVTKLKVGNLRLPSVVAQLFIKEYLESKLKSVTSALGVQGAGVSFSNPAFKIQNIALNEGYLAIEIYIDQAKLQENLKQLPELIQQIQNFAATKAELTPTSTSIQP